MALSKLLTRFLGVSLALGLGDAGALIKDRRGDEGSTALLGKLQTYDWRPRIFILSDILNEPDDSMSLVRYLLYSNEFDTRGLCATTSWWLKNETHPEQMETIIKAYGDVVDNLNQHVHPDNQYQPAEDFLKLITTGPSTYGMAALDEPISEGAQRLIASLQESEEPLYVPAWGGTNTLAQALDHLDRTVAADEAASLRSRIRLYTISDQDDTGAWMRARYPDMFYVASVHSFNEYQAATWTGINLATCACVSNETVLNPWLDDNIRLGPLGAQYPQIIYGMEGDTPSFLWLVQNGLGHRDRIDWGSWGGRYSLPLALSDIPGRSGANHYVNAADNVTGADGAAWQTPQATIWRWRAAYQDDFAARMQWSLSPDFAGAAHPPVVDVNGHQGPEPLTVRTRGNQTHTLDAGATLDPDGADELSFLWMLYPEVTFYASQGDNLDMRGSGNGADGGDTDLAAVNDAGFAWTALGSRLDITVPAPWDPNPNTGVKSDFHLILQVTNSAGKYPIRRYLRVVFEYEDEE